MSNFPLWFSGLFFLIWSRAHFQLFTFFASGYLDVLNLEHILDQPHYCLLFQPNPTHLLFAVAVWISISLVEPALGSRGEEKETENSILAFTTRQIGKSSRWNLGETSFQSNLLFHNRISWNISLLNISMTFYYKLNFRSSKILSMKFAI